MLKIAICDDEVIFIDMYKKVIKKIQDEHQYNLDIHTYRCGEDLIDDMIIHEKQFDLIFLDIVMGTLNGIETAREIRKMSQMVPIVFLTSSKEYALDSYEIRAFNYIMKNSSQLEVQMLEAIVACCQKKVTYITIQNKSIIEKIDINDIVYIESNRRKIIVKTKGGMYETYEKLDTIFAKLSRFGFVRTHRSYIVNLAYIQKITPKEITTIFGDSVIVSRSNADSVKMKFMEYLQQLK
ncbi:MAG: LytR/AlgR family response regulator transcription factor [Culicoidibacterales bacterium]